MNTIIAWFESFDVFYEDPYFWLMIAPVIFGIIYVATSFFGERGE